MRLPFAPLLLCLLLAGCFGRKPPTPASSPSPQPSPPPVARPAPTSTPTPKPSPVKEKPTVSFFNAGRPTVWATTDAEGELFDFVLFPNGQMITNRTKGNEGAQGEHGVWHQDGTGLVTIYADGRKDTISSQPDGFRRQEIPAQAAPGSPATAALPFQPVIGKAADFVGIWRLNIDPNGTYQFVALRSDGRAFSNVNGGTEGTWKATDRGAECQWSDGWSDLIAKVNGQWEKYTCVGNHADQIIDSSPAKRLGEDGSITP